MKLEHQMKWRRTLASWVIASITIGFVGSELHGQGAPPIPDQEQPEILTRGPVHEAFAEPVNMQYQEAQLAPSEPPENIQEVPPEDRPEGDQYVWVPGYWSWDAGRTNYIWVSACWRAAPPRMSWTPGYWSQTNGGWEWIAGFWGSEDAQDVEYFPTPPVPDGIEPPGPPPSVDVVWVPPCAYWSNGGYVERPGYWLKTQPGWMWVASHYVWTPRGYVFSPGHWDYPLEDRGVLFAPVAIPRGAYSRRGYTYSPSVVVDTTVLSANLFVSLRYSHYFFGDYYDDDAIQVGIVPWFDRRSSRTWYDPMYEYRRASARVTITEWDQRERHEFDARRSNRDLRPPRTYRELETRVARAPVEQRTNIQVVQSYKTVVNNTTINNTTINNNRTTVNNNRTTVNNNNATVNNNSASKIKFAKLDAPAQQKIAAQAAQQKKLGDQRKGWEAPAKTAAKPAAAPQAAPNESDQPRLAAERNEPAATPAARGRGTVNPPAEPQATPAPTPTNRGRGNAANQTAQPEARPAQTPAERGRAASPATQPEARPAPSPSGRNRGPAANPAAEQESTPAPANRGRGPTANRGSDSDDKTPAAAAPANRGRGAAQREAQVAQPEKVKIPDAQPAARGRTAGKAPPADPDDEVKRKGDPKDTPKSDDKPATQPANRRGGR